MVKIKESEKLRVFIDRINNSYYELKNNRLIKNGREIGTITSNGYLFYSIGKGGIYAHRLIFAYYHGIDELHKYESVNHIDGDKLNNNINNLEGLSLKENSKHQWEIGLAKRGEDCSYAKLTEKEVKEIKKLLRLGYIQRTIADYYNVHRSTILGINLKLIWAHVEYDESVKVPQIKNVKKKRSDRKFDDEKVNEIKSLYTEGVSQIKLSKKFNVSRGTIKKVVNDIY